MTMTTTPTGHSDAHSETAHRTRRTVRPLHTDYRVD
jgi:hypothetical protein